MKSKLFSILLYALLFFSLLTACAPDRTGIVEVKFNSEMTQVDLDSIQAALKAQNIDLTYDQLEFDEDGHLRKISASIDYPDGHSGSFTSAVLSDGDGPGFYRDFSKF